MFIPLGAGHQLEERQELDRAQGGNQAGNDQYPGNQRQAQGLFLPPKPPCQHGQQQPCQKNDLRRSGQHLHRAHQGGGYQPTSTPLPAQLHTPHDPRHPAQGGNIVGPHQAVERESIEGVGQPGNAGGQSVARPAPRQPIHPQASQKLVKKAIDAQRPGQREEQVKKRSWVEHERIPLRQERQPAIVERIPQRDFASPETVPMVKGQGIPEVSKVTKEKRGHSKNHFRVSCKNGCPQNDCQTALAEARVRLVEESRACWTGLLQGQRNNFEVRQQ